jgi:hypothetical protein
MATEGQTPVDLPLQVIILQSPNRSVNVFIEKTVSSRYKSIYI